MHLSLACSMSAWSWYDLFTWLMRCEWTPKNRRNRNNCAGRANHPPYSSISFIATEGAYKAAFLLLILLQKWSAIVIKMCVLLKPLLDIKDEGIPVASAVMNALHFWHLLCEGAHTSSERKQRKLTEQSLFSCLCLLRVQCQHVPGIICSRGLCPANDPKKQKE